MPDVYLGKISIKPKQRERLKELLGSKVRGFVLWDNGDCYVNHEDALDDNGKKKIEDDIKGLSDL